MILSSKHYVIGLGGLLALIVAFLIVVSGGIASAHGNEGGSKHDDNISDSVKQIIKNVGLENEVTVTKDVAVNKVSSKSVKTSHSNKVTGTAHYKTVVNKNQNFVVSSLAIESKDKSYNIFTRDADYFANFSDNCWYKKTPGSYDKAKKGNVAAGLFNDVKSAKVDGDHIVIIYKNKNHHSFGKKGKKHAVVSNGGKRGHYKVVRKTAYLYLNDAHTLPTHGTFKTYDGKYEITKEVEFSYSAISAPRDVGDFCPAKTKSGHHK